MNGDVNAEAQRPRPLSGGIWTLFSWLRREDRSISSDSLSSAGSDRTAASFSFLEPLHYSAAATPIVLPRLSPPTDSYKKRVRERNLRKQRERDITLHRKYGLFKGDITDRYDAFSLPAARKRCTTSIDRVQREKRAASECLQRRAPYVPGKRRAPLPPSASITLPRGISRKRPAPQPPIKLGDNIKDNNIEKSFSEQMNSKHEGDTCSLPNKIIPSDAKIDQNDKQDNRNNKIKLDKSFLKQIFENRKRNSVTEPTYVKLLPNISELDKQAAEIIENKKLKNLHQITNNSNDVAITKKMQTLEEKWMCTVCFKKYNVGVSSCLYCIANQEQSTKSAKNYNKNVISNVASCTQTDKQFINMPSTSKVNGNDEKKKLKEMLKEMKDSLPKRPKHNISANETPTLRIGSTTLEHELNIDPRISSFNEIVTINSDNDVFKINPNNTENGILSSFTSSSDKYLVDSVNNPRASPTSTYLKENLKVTSNDKNNNLEKEPKRQLNIPIIHNPPTIINTQTNFNTSIQNNILESKVMLSNKINDFTHKENIKEPQIHLSQEKRNSLAINSSNDNIEVTKFSQFQPNIPINNPSPPLSEKSKQTKENVTTTMSGVPQADSTSDTSLPQAKAVTTAYEKTICPQSASPNKSSLVLQVNDTASLKTLENKFVGPSVHITKVTDFSGNLHTPLKISSLLNPDYSLKNTQPSTKGIDTKLTPKQQQDIKLQTCALAHLSSTNSNVITISSTQTSSTSLLTKPLMTIKEVSETNERESSLEKQKLLTKQDSKIPFKKLGIEKINDHYDLKTPSSKHVPQTVIIKTPIPSTSNDAHRNIGIVEKLDKHSRRRDLIKKLEQSIAKGDEQAAADAAVELAKLRLSCSVLSFSSQIVGNASTSSDVSTPVTNTAERNDNVTKSDDINRTLEVSLNTKTAPLTQKPESSKSNNLQSEANKLTGQSQSIVSKKDIFQNKLLSEKKIQTQMVEPSTSKPFVPENANLNIQIWVEDKEATRGPISLQISQHADVGELRRQAEGSLGLASRLQRWIVGRTLCLDDNAPLISLAGPNLKAPFYLCVVEAEANKESGACNKIKEVEKHEDLETKVNTGEVYTELIKLEKQALVLNAETFECAVCMEECLNGQGAVLRECIHMFCRNCLSDIVRHCEEPIVSCPAIGCSGNLQEREIRALLSIEEYEQWLARGLAAAESGTRNAFHCRTRDCTGWAMCEPGVRKFPCPVCKQNNCVPCQAIHDGKTCEQYQAKLRETIAAVQTNDTDKNTQTLLNNLIKSGEALECPECHAILTKKWGCDWVKCSACKTEICWVTRGRRWGPSGRGDTTAGCRCGVDGKRCHPSCGYCH